MVQSALRAALRRCLDVGAAAAAALLQGYPSFVSMSELDFWVAAELAAAKSGSGSGALSGGVSPEPVDESAGMGLFLATAAATLWR